MTALKGKSIVLGVSGSIAAYKAVDLASKLVQAGAKVDVIMTTAALEFVTPLTFRSITHRPVVYDMFDPGSELAVEHVALAHRADILVIAPATANTMAKLAGGSADEMLTATALATRAPILVAPAMDAGMYQNRATQDNITRLKERGVAFVGPEEGRLASGEIGLGRFSEAATIMGHIRLILGRGGDYAGRRVLVSAGPTQEPFDPVRHITNPSSGKMGYAVAEAARDRGARVTLVTGPVALADPVGVEMVKVRTALQMREAVLRAAQSAEAVIMTAAVSDYRPSKIAAQKIKKGGERLTIEMVKNPDIIAETQGNFVKVGFAAESQDLIANAREKLVSKNLDLVAANDITAADAGFAVDTNRIILLDREGQADPWPLLTKEEVAERLLDRVLALLKKRAQKPKAAPAPGAARLRRPVARPQ
ncbi:MAG: bifunctional phosphopantothenoylcysteine decarboxylase/phosphopantothenate--cysteine ligase CoaBC [Chloroflexi bacterium]|nr:bifunctional phosphopantothenoylcysteine decarboxylase/phosphopantothenate--cysteine ligase CoaBC [Chloroflexota bacterium]